MKRKTSWRSANYRYVAQPGEPPSTEPKAMKARFAGKCEQCGGAILPGEDMLWIPATRKARHATCPAVPTPVAAVPQIACPKCGQQVYQQVSKYGKPYFTNSANRQDFHPCRVWTGRRKYPAKLSVAPVNLAPIGSSPTMSPLTPMGTKANAIVQAAFDAIETMQAENRYGEEYHGDATRGMDDRTWTAVERDLAVIDKSLAAIEDVPENTTARASLVIEKTHCLNRLALLTWERIRYDS